ncbi:hypothetical protein IHQ68_10125 [Chelatococcus sambhunathii]|uniref:DUF7694 domain-containing protein n=1 Tax=Chelatococcus sambhunathii TaxID=363953 RepID=A0ABU1DFR9_9HYPH|nr:hypothetical protein [Chelatococcus sambhunathii]MDR4306974.1 hypothetical protein [Chelatococcus sambhunathii]
MITDPDLLRFLTAGDDDWGDWRRDPNHPNDLAFENDRFSIICMEEKTSSGVFLQVVIYPKHIDLREGEPRWRDKQRIKNELFGEDTVAIEVMPRHSDVVAVGNAYHLWIVPPQFKLPCLVRGFAEAGGA